MTAPNLQLPSKPITRGGAGSGSQRDRRFTDTFWDTYKHPRFPKGRPFTGIREFQSGSATESINAGFLQSDLQCGEYFCDSPEHTGGTGQTPEERALTLASGWIAPWLPPGGKKYMQFNYRAKRITFDYVKGEMDERNALRTYYLAAAKVAGANGWTEVKPGVVPTYQVTAIVGSPTPFLPVWQAARAGDPWLMGAVDEPNERLAKVLGLGDVQYLGGTEFGDSEYVVLPPRTAPDPLIQPDAILSIPMDQIAAMIEAALAKRDAEIKEKNRAKMANARAARKPVGANA